VADLAGVSIDCADPGQLVEFYQRLLGGRVLWHSVDSAAIEARGIVLVMQRVANYVPPVWPGASVVHFDFAPPPGSTLDQCVAGALDAGAQLTAHQVDPRWVVLLDPAGHPFCVTSVTPASY
jgi:catechol-2,3-dioxygenase